MQDPNQDQQREHQQQSEHSQCPAGSVIPKALSALIGAVGIAMLLVFSVVMSSVCMSWVKYDRLLAASK